MLLEFAMCLQPVCLKHFAEKKKLFAFCTPVPCTHRLFTICLCTWTSQNCLLCTHENADDYVVFWKTLEDALDQPERIFVFVFQSLYISYVDLSIWHYYVLNYKFPDWGLTKIRFHNLISYKSQFPFCCLAIFR